MQTSLLIAGFGGQGVLFAGQLLAHAALDAAKHVTWIPSYGPEMRGGTAHCTVVIGDRPIGSPFARHPEIVLALNQPSAVKYARQMALGGLLVVNTSLAPLPETRPDVRLVGVAANELAEAAGDLRLANVVMLGALLAVQPVLCPASVESALERYLPERHRKLLAANLSAFRAGMAAARQPVAVMG
ncbi:MAG: 2-oxoacid:acceptor oxidoreductase family protein [Caldilineaceae bacterium]|nr:2-oxoacid:acceptor oxidoreductase family protein [Caldilineaceae bacterium]